MTATNIQAVDMLLKSMTKDVVRGLEATGGKRTGTQAKVTDWDGNEIAVVKVEVTPL